MELMTKFNHVTLDIIGLCAFGYTFNSVMNGYDDESKCISQIVSGGSGVHRKLIESKVPLLKLIPSKGREEGKNAEKACENLIRKVGYFKGKRILPTILPEYVQILTFLKLSRVSLYPHILH